MLAMIKKIIRLFRQVREYEQFKQLQIPFNEFRRLKNSVGGKSTSLFGRPIEFTDHFWYLHSINELFIEKVYSFQRVGNCPVIIDCGSNIGLSIIFFKKYYPNAHVIGFEPDDEIYKIAQKNLSFYKYDNVKLHQKAVWTKNGQLQFEKLGSLSGHITDIEGNDNINVEAIRLADLLNTKVDFLKIDIEGAEYEILLDCRDKLNNVENLFIEYHSNHNTPQMLAELLEIVKSSGFRVYIKEAWENMKNPFIEKKGPHFDLQLNIFCYRVN